MWQAGFSLWATTAPWYNPCSLTWHPRASQVSLSLCHPREGLSYCLSSLSQTLLFKSWLETHVFYEACPAPAGPSNHICKHPGIIQWDTGYFLYKDNCLTTRPIEHPKSLFLSLHSCHHNTYLVRLLLWEWKTDNTFKTVNMIFASSRNRKWNYDKDDELSPYTVMWVDDWVWQM